MSCQLRCDQCGERCPWIGQGAGEVQDAHGWIEDGRRHFCSDWCRALHAADEERRRRIDELRGAH